MYIPKINLTTDSDEIREFMQAYSFATIITVKDNIPIATHLPFIVKSKGDEILLISHFAKANDHWQLIEDNTSLIIFTEPHAYISTQNYDKEMNVPTWNYIAVHAYGKGRVITEIDATYEILEMTIDNYEGSFKESWNSFPEEYKMRMSKGIVPFEITVTDIQAKKKLSQNRTDSEKKRIINTLSESTDYNARLIAKYMEKE